MMLIAWVLTSVAFQDAAVSSEPVLHLKNDGKPVRSLAFSRDGSGLLSGGCNPRIWDLSSGQERRRFAVPWGDALWTLGHSQDGRTIAAFEYSKEVIELWEERTGFATVSVFPGGRVTAVALAPDGSFIISLADGILRHDLRDFAKPPLRYEGQPDEVADLALSPDGKTLAASGSDRTVHLWESATGRALRVLRTEDLEGSLLVFSPRGDVLVEGGKKEKAVVLWDVATGKPRCRIEGFQDELSSIALTSDGRFLATLEENRHVQFWELASGKPVLKVSGGSEKAYTLAISPDGSRVAAGTDDGDILVWNTNPGVVAPIDPEQTWVRLADEDAAKAYLAACGLRTAGEKSADFLKRRLQATPDAKQLETMLAELESADASIRDEARKKLDGFLHDPTVWKSLEKSASEEVRLGMQEYLQNRGRIPMRSPEALRRVRAVAVLEALGVAETLEEISRGAEKALQTVEARSALDRLRHPK